MLQNNLRRIYNPLSDETRRFLKSRSRGMKPRKGGRAVKPKTIAVFSSVVMVLVVLTFPPPVEAQRTSSVAAVNWPLHNLDLAGSRFSALDQINRANVKSLTPRWLFQHGVIDGVSNQTTPVIVDGVICDRFPRERVCR